MNALILLIALAEDLPPSNQPLPPTPVDVYDDYGKAYHEAVHLNRPLLVWVGQRPRKSGDNVDCYQPTFTDYIPDCPAKCVVVSKPDGKGGLAWLKTLEGTPAKEEIQNTLRASSLESRVTPRPISVPSVRYARSC